MIQAGQKPFKQHCSNLFRQLVITLNFNKVKKKIFPYLAFVLMVCLATACRKVIPLDLVNATPQMVIEANLSDQPGGQKIILSKTTSYFETLPQQFFSG